MQRPSRWVQNQSQNTTEHRPGRIPLQEVACNVPDQVRKLDVRGCFAIRRPVSLSGEVTLAVGSGSALACCPVRHEIVDVVGRVVVYKCHRRYRPQTNGKLERFHRILLRGWANPIGTLTPHSKYNLPAEHT